ncbi:MAG: MmgE/PrpD family protein [Phycisphaerales bacterium]
MIPRPIEDSFVDFAAAAAERPLTPSQDRFLKRIVLDTLAIAMGAAMRERTAGGRALAALAPGHGAAALWGRDRRADPATAALVNGADAEVLDFQEVLIDGRNNGHAAVVIVPALLALAQHRGCHGTAFLRALGSALEANVALLRAAGRGHRSGDRGIRTTALAPPIAAALAAGPMLGLGREATHNALSLAASALPIGLLAAMAPGNHAFTADKDLAVGQSARHAVECALFAEAGIDAAPAALSGSRGWLATFGYETAETLAAPDPELACLPRYALKPYAANFGAQSAIMALLSLRARTPVDGVERITVRVKRSSSRSLSTREIGNPLAARFSLPYVAATTWARGAPTLADFEAPAIGAPEVLALMARVTVEGDDALEAMHLETGRFPARVRVEGAGRAEEAAVDDPWQGMDDAAIDAVIRRKVHDLLGASWPAGRVDALIAAVEHLGEAEGLDRLTALL